MHEHMHEQHHGQGDSRLVLAELRAIRHSLQVVERMLVALHHQGDALMAISKELQDAMASIDDATTTVGKRITDLSSQITTGMSTQDVASVVAKLNAEADKLRSIAADPNNPVPPAVTNPPGEMPVPS